MFTVYVGSILTTGLYVQSLSAGGEVVDPLQMRPWGASDGQVVDRYGVHWLIGYEEEPPATI